MMPYDPVIKTALDEWPRREAIPFDPESTDSLDAAVDALMSQLADNVQLLALGEPMHGAEEFLTFRNQMFRRLVESHGFTAIAIESSYTRGRIMNDFVCNASGMSFDEVKETGISHGWSRYPSMRKLVEWMRHHNARLDQKTKLHFYGFDAPTEMTYADSPRQLLEFVLGYLESVDPGRARTRRDRMAALWRADTDWENAESGLNPSKSIGATPAAVSLRLETEDLITELKARRPELIEKTDDVRFQDALHDALHARQLLTYHAALAGTSPNRFTELLALRDVMMAENLVHIGARERSRGRVLVFAHNYHLKYSMAAWQWGQQRFEWWPAGAHVRSMIGPAYAVVGAGVGTSEKQGIDTPEKGTLEERLTRSDGPARFIKTHGGAGLPLDEIAALPTRSTSSKNSSYFPFTEQSLSEFDWLAVLDSIQ